MVAGDPLEKITEDQNGNPLVIKTGANIGKPTQKYYLAIAIPKTDPKLAELFQACQVEAKKAFPSLFDANGRCARQDFAWKLDDGDSTVLNKNNVRPCDREGWPGHYIFHLSTSLPIKCFSKLTNTFFTEPGILKRGYYVMVNVAIKGNDQTTNPGIYLNPATVVMVAYGEEITYGPSVEELSALPVSLPPGASTTPLAPSIASLPPNGTGPMSAPTIPTYPPMGAAPATPVVTTTPAAGVQYPANVQPAPTFLNPPGAASAALSAPVAPAPVVPVAPAPAAPPAAEPRFKNTDGQIYTYSQLTGYGWTDAQIRMLPQVI
jgi:hypothetical protein